MSIAGAIFLFLISFFGSLFFYGLWLIESDNDEFRKKNGYKPKYHDHRKDK